MNLLTELPIGPAEYKYCVQWRVQSSDWITKFTTDTEDSAKELYQERVAKRPELQWRLVIEVAYSVEVLRHGGEK